MPTSSLAVLLQAIQSITVNAACPYLTATITGDNTFGNPKEVELRVRHYSSLVV
jgi:hypothetical protein